MKKVASCQKKPYQLVDRYAFKNESKEDAEQRQVKFEAGLQDVHNLRNEDTLEDKEKDTLGDKYLKVVNSI